MPSKRTKVAPKRIAISPAAIEAWKAGDFFGLYHALALAPHVATPWPLEITALGVSQDRYEDVHPWDRNPAPWAIPAWERAQALQRALYEAAGPPGRLKER